MRDDDTGGELARTGLPPVQVRFSSRLTIEWPEGYSYAVLTTALPPALSCFCPVEACLNWTEHSLGCQAEQEFRAAMLPRDTAWKFPSRGLAAFCTKCMRVIPYRDDGAAARVTVISRTKVGLSAALVFACGRLGNR